MTLIVEDGSIVANANCYVDTTYLATYASDRGISIVGDKEVLLIRAMDYIEQLYYIGAKFTLSQPLQWPRYGVCIDGWYQNVNSIPYHLKHGLCEVALAIDAGNSPLANLDPQVKREKVGDIEVEYMSGTNSNPVVVAISNSLQKIVKGGGLGGSFLVSKA